MTTSIGSSMLLFSRITISPGSSSCISDIARDVEEIHVEIEGEERMANFFDAKLRVHTYVLDEDGAGEEMLSEEQEVSSLSQWNLPAIEFKDSWDTLVFDSEIKQRLLRYARLSIWKPSLWLSSRVKTMDLSLILMKVMKKTSTYTST